MSVSPHYLRAYVDYLRDMGVYDLYRRDDPQTMLTDELRYALLEKASPLTQSVFQAERQPTTTPAAAKLRQQSLVPGPSHDRHAPAVERLTKCLNMEPSQDLPASLASPMPVPVSFDKLAPLTTQTIPPAQRAEALEAVRAEIGDCTRCPLAYAGRHTIVFADGDPNAKLMFVGEGPGADEDASGLPFVGKAGQLLNNMITAMGLAREQVYIANIVKCRPPGNRVPEPVEANTCSQFLVKQIDIVRPQVIVALGSTAATYLLGVKQSLATLRGKWHSTRGSKLIVTYHPAFLLRDPRQKGEAWKDLQMAMTELGLKSAKKP